GPTKAWKGPEVGLLLLAARLVRQFGRDRRLWCCWWLLMNRGGVKKASGAALGGNPCEGVARLDAERSLGWFVRFGKYGPVSVGCLCRDIREPPLANRVIGTFAD
ncbi:MAG: hypothetical protein ABL949_03600, partial [Fimbriimonadaceae bacterium]